ncbi:MAG: anti-sigma factor [Armatimonadota bacterium]
MTCPQVRQELVACWGSTDELRAEVVEHLCVCEACRWEAALLRETRVLLHSLPAEQAPDGLTARVLARIANERAPESWRQRLAAWFVPAQQPVWARAAAVALAIALAAAGGTAWYQGTQATAPEPTISSAPAPGGQVAIADREFEELLRRHQSLELSQPLADDAGVSLVVYTPY